VLNGICAKGLAGRAPPGQRHGLLPRLQHAQEGSHHADRIGGAIVEAELDGGDAVSGVARDEPDRAVVSRSRLDDPVNWWSLRSLGVRKPLALRERGERNPQGVAVAIVAVN
jgi:hypothetical protein